MEIDKQPFINKKNIALLLAGAGTLIFLIVSYVIFSQLTASKNRSLESSNTSITQNANPAYIYFSSPTTKLLKTKQRGILSDITLDTQGKNVGLVQIELLYDASIISNVSFIKSEDSTSPFSKFKTDQTLVDQAKGIAFITLLLDTADLPKSGKGVIATLKYDVNNLTNVQKSVISIQPLTILLTTDRKEIKFEKTDTEIDFSLATNP